MFKKIFVFFRLFDCSVIISKHKKILCKDLKVDITALECERNREDIKILYTDTIVWSLKPIVSLHHVEILLFKICNSQDYLIISFYSYTIILCCVIINR